MLESLRKNSGSFFTILLIGSLATLFGVNFGPASRGCSREQLTVNYIARVYDHTISEDDFRSVARLTMGDRDNTAVMRRAIVNGLIERELLAHQADRLGMRVSTEDINREIADGYYYLTIGFREASFLQARSMYSVWPSARHLTSYNLEQQQQPAAGQRPVFEYSQFEDWVRRVYGRMVPDYKRLLERELLAERMRNAVMANVRVSEDEVWADYRRQHNQVALRYLQFSPDFYRLLVDMDDQATIDTWGAAHLEEVTRAVDRRRDSLHGLPAQVRLRQLFLRYPENADAAARAAVQGRAQTLHDRISGGQSFVRMARLFSNDELNWRTGGETQWVAVDNVQLPDDVKRELPSLQVGTLSAPITSTNGVYLVQVLGRRQGDIDDASARREVTRELYQLDRATALAELAARHAQTLLGAPAATIDQVAATIHSEALTAFYRGEVPAPETLAPENTLEPVAHTDVNAPELRESQSFTLDGSIPGIENSETLVRAAFELTEAAPTPSAPIPVGEERFVIRLKDGSRQEASRADFDRERGALMDSFAHARREEALKQLLARLRAEAERAGELRLGTSPLLQDPAARTPAPTVRAPSAPASGGAARPAIPALAPTNPPTLPTPPATH